MNFTFIPSPEKAKKVTAVEDAHKPKLTLQIGRCWEMLGNGVLGNGDRPHFRRLCVSSMNPDLVYYYTSKYKCFIDYEFVLLEK